MRVRLMLVAALTVVMVLPAAAPVSLADGEAALPRRTPDPLAVRVWADSGPFFYRWFHIYFESKDAASQPDRYQMRVRRDGPRRALTDWKLRRYVLPDTVIRARGGGRACVQVRAKEAGVVGPWSRAICRTGVIPGYRLDGWRVAPDDRLWSPLTKRRSAFGGTVLYTDDAGARVRISDVQIKRVNLWALRCGNCGKVVIELNGKVIGRADLSARQRHSDRVWHREFRHPRHGRLTFTVTSPDGRLVQLDAVSIERNNRLSR